MGVCTAAMDVNDRKTLRRSSAASSMQIQPRSAGAVAGVVPEVYQSETAPSARSASSKRCPSSQPERPQHPSLNRVKGRANMNTPPRMSPEMSWLKDQSPVRGTRTPPRQCKTPESGTPPTLVNPASSLLQGLLKEQRAHRGSRGAGSEDWNSSRPRTPENRSIQEDTASEKSRKMKDTFTASREQPKEMGVREMDQYVSKITKLNFDLKLEIFHRTQQMGTMEKKIERMQEMEEELEQMHKLEEEVVELREAKKHNRSLQESNDQLREELHKRNQAVTEAVQLICQLEAKIDEIELGGRTSQASFTRLVLDGPNATPRKQTVLEIPERTSSRRASLKSPETRTLNKVPSFLRGSNDNTPALRSLYAPEVNNSFSAMSELTKSESFNTMNDILEPASPRLSVLSECSELYPPDTPTKWDQSDKLNIPVRKAASTESFDSYDPPVQRERTEDDEIDQWTESNQDMPQTIVRRRMNRMSADASKIPTAPFHLYSAKAQGRPKLDESLFAGVKLPPTPDTMSTAHVAGRNSSNGSMAAAAAAHRSPKPGHDLWLAGRPLERHRSADELTTQTRRSFNGSDITDSMQTNCSDTPRIGFMKDKESPTIFPFNTVASKASELLGPGSPNNPVVDSFGGLLRQDSNGSRDEAIPPPIPAYQTPTKHVKHTRSTDDDDSPPLTPQDWVAAARQDPRSRKEPNRGLRIEQDERDELPRKVISQAAFHDGDSVDSYPMEHDAPGVPTLDMETLNILEQPLAEVPEEPTQEQKTEREQRRRFSFRPAFLNRAHLPRRLQHSHTVPDLMDDDEEDGAPSPIIPKTRNMGGAGRRPMSQIITNSGDFYSSSVPAPNPGFGNENFTVKSLHQSLMENRDENTPITHQGSATISGRPTTSHSADHKRRSSLGIFGWMKGMGAKRSESAMQTETENFADSVNVKDTRPVSRLTHETSRLTLGRSSTPDSMDAPVVRPRSEMTMYSDDQSRRPRYMGRRARRG